jgi:predicted ATPase
MPTNLPLLLTSFVGRTQEIAQVNDLLVSTRLLTLTGAGGVGKTRLALHVGHDLQQSYADGVWLVDLAPLSDLELVPQALASALELREAGG